MALTTFERVFDSTFPRATVDPTTNPIPNVGGERGRVAAVVGAALSFTNTSDSVHGNAIELLTPRPGQYSERWAGVPMTLKDYILPFILAVPLPTNLATSPYCTDALSIVNADTGVKIMDPYGVTLHRVQGGDTLYVIFTGGKLFSAANVAASLPDGAYRLELGGAYSVAFSVRAACTLLRVRMVNDSRLGDLLYLSYGFQQIFFVEGQLNGPTYETQEETSGDVRTSATVTKKYTLHVDGVNKTINEALAYVSLHKVVEVSTLRADGSVLESVEALPYKAKSTAQSNSQGGFDIDVTLPVNDLSWNAPGAIGCAGGSSDEILVEVSCSGGNSSPVVILPP